MNPNDLYRLFFEESGDALMAVQLPEGRVSFVNPAFLALTGYARDEVVGESLSVLTPTIELSRERAIDLAMLELPGFYNDVALPTRDGGTRFVTVKVKHALLDGRPAALAVLADDTERQLLVRDLTAKHQSLEMAYVDLERVHTELQETQAKMMQASKLMALGELAAGMSHELNQPLTGIRGFAQEIYDLLRTQAKPRKGDIAKLSQSIVSNADKMAALLAHLREFARQGRESASTPVADALTETVPLARAFKNVEMLLARQLAKNEVRLEGRGLDIDLQALPHPIEQVLINLITNSRDACLERRARGDERDYRGRILVSAALEGGQVCLRVSDNGAGISDAVRERVFDPFFSTKQTGQGMGLGLAISYGIAHRLHGDLRLESTSPSGSTFALRLPAAKPARSAA